MDPYLPVCHAECILVRKMDDDFMLVDDWTTNLDSCADRELNRLKNVHSKAGYRDGVSDGKESMLQAGFNAGFSEATDKYRQSSKLRGCISAMMIFFKCKSCGSENLMKDLGSFLTELKNIEAVQPEIDEAIVEEIARSDKNKELEDTTVEAIHCKDIETLVDDLSFMESDDGITMQHPKIPQGTSCFEDNVSAHSKTEDVVHSCQYQRKDNNQSQKYQIKDGQRSRLKYSFRIDHEMGRLEQLLKDHNVSDDILQNLRKSVLFDK